MNALHIHNALASITASVQALQVSHKDLLGLVTGLRKQHDLLVPAAADVKTLSTEVSSLEGQVRKLNAEVSLLNAEVKKLGNESKQQRSITEATIMMKCESQLSRTIAQQVNIMAGSLEDRIRAMEDGVRVLQETLLFQQPLETVGTLEIPVVAQTDHQEEGSLQT